MVCFACCSFVFHTKILKTVQGHHGLIKAIAFSYLTWVRQGFEKKR